MRIPFTYIIASEDHLYVGSKYGVDAHPSMLLKTYFTSSKYAKPLILKDPLNWKIIRIQEGKSTEEVVKREMEWQQEFRHHKGILNKSIDRANGKWINYGPMSDATKAKMSLIKKGHKQNTPEVSALIGNKNRGKQHTVKTKNAASVAKTEFWKKMDEDKRIAIGKAISETMKSEGTSVGSKNSNATKWIMKSPEGTIFTQPETMAGKEFIQSLGLSYQMLIKFRSIQQEFKGKLVGWEVVYCSRSLNQNQYRSGRISKH